MVVSKSSLTTLFVLLPTVASFQLAPSTTRTSIVHVASAARDSSTSDNGFDDPNRREFMRAVATSAGAFLSTLVVAESASAGIDVSGLRQETGGQNVIASQLKSYDGSATARIDEIRTAQSQQATPSPSFAPAAAETGSAATYAYRSGGYPTLRKLGLGLLNRYEGYVVPPPDSNMRQISISFDFPSDWLMIDKTGGGINYVDQRNGDKLYVLRAPLPEGTTLETVPKSFFAESIFDTRGDIARSGTVVESSRATRSTMLEDCQGGKICSPRRRLLVKYDTVTGNGVQTVERRGLVDAYEVGGYAYMLMTSSNAVKFDAKGAERETVEAIVDSFRLGF